MAWMKMTDPEKAEGKAKDLLVAVRKKLGKVPNAHWVMPPRPDCPDGFRNTV